MSDGAEATASDRETRDPRTGRFRPGNPGRPPGAGFRALALLDQIGQEGAAEVLRVVLASAKAGDMRAADILLRRLWPERKGRPVQFDLPPLSGPAAIVGAIEAVARSVAEGQLSPEEGQAVAAIAEAHRRAVETADLAARLTALEERAK